MSKNKNKIIIFRLNEDEYSLLKKNAELQESSSVNDYCRKVTLSDISKKNKDKK